MAPGVNALRNAFETDINPLQEDSDETEQV